MDDDSPETITAGFTLGIQHPPGYPLYALLTRLACLVPVGSMGFRANVFSALLAALAVALAAILIRLFLTPETAASQRRGKEVFPRPFLLLIGALAGALILAFSRTFWEQALGAKGGIYLLDQVLLFSIFYFLLKSGQGTGRWLYSAWFAFGLGLTNHWQLQLLFLPAFLVLALPAGERKKTRNIPHLKTTLTALSFILLGLSSLLCLPLRAHLHPTLNLGAPDNYGRFLDALFRKYYSYRERGAVQTLLLFLGGGCPWGQVAATLKATLDFQGRQVSTHFLNSMGLFSLALSGAGFYFFWRQRRERLLFILLAPFLLLMLSLYLLPPMEQDLWRLDRFLLPSDGILALLAGAGLYFLFLSWEGGPLRQTAKAWPLVAFLIPLGMALGNFHGLDEERQMVRYDYGMNLLKSIPARVIFFAEADEDYFPFYYLQGVEAKRLDVKMVPTFTLFETWGVEQMAGRHETWGLGQLPSFTDPYHRIEAAVSMIVEKNKGQAPIAFSRFDGAFHRYYLEGQKNLALRPSGAALLLATPLTSKTVVPTSEELRVRHCWGDCPSNQHPSLNGIWTVYRLIDALPPTPTRASCIP